MSFASWTQAHRRSILFLVAVLAGTGIIAAFKLPVTLFPRVDFPRIDVTLDVGDRPADRMVLQVTRPVEEAVRKVPRVVEVRSTTSRGSADVSVTMAWSTDTYQAALQVNAAISEILSSLPPGTAVTVRRMDPTVYPIIAYSLTSNTISQTALYDLAEYQLRPLLSSVNGVARVGVVGGAVEEYRVTVDPNRLEAYGLSFQDVARALGASNVVQAVGRLEDHDKLYLVVSNTQFKDLPHISQTVLRSGVNGLVRLEDVATVAVSTEPQWTRVTADGKPAVLLSIYQQPDGNSVDIARQVKAQLSAFNPHLPKGVTLANWYDQSRLVIASAASVRDAILLGMVLAAVVLFVFLRSLRITLVAVMVVPAVLASTVVLLYALGMSFNIMTLGGMATAVGLIIDDAIVMNEHIVRRLRQGVGAKVHGALEAAREFFHPLSGSSAATIVVFTPLAFLSGLTGSFFKALSLTIATSLIISFCVTWLAVPILAGHFLTVEADGREESGRITHLVHGAYDWLMRRLIPRPYLILLVLLPLAAGGYLAYRQVGSGFMPVMDEGGFILDYRSPPGTALTETDRLLKQVENILEHVPEVSTYSRRTGLALGGTLSEANEGDFFVRLTPLPRRPIWQVMDEVRHKVEKLVPGLEIETAQLMEDLIGDLTAVPQPVEVKIFGDNEKELEGTAREVATALKKVKGLIEIRNGIIPAGDAQEIHVDRSKAALEGVDPEAITAILQDYLTGSVTTQVEKGVKMVGVRLWIPQSLRATDTDLHKLRLRAPDGHLFPLSRIASIVALSGQPQIDRDNLKRMLAITGRISGRDMGSVIRDVKQVLRKKTFPKGMYYELGGLYKQQQIAFHGLVIVFIAAFSLVLLLTLYLYENFRLSACIMLMPLLATAVVFVGLWLTGIELNISSMMGMTMSIGIITEAAIFYFSEFKELAKTGDFTEAVIEAGKNRMRPIAMTTLAAILTLIPLALAIGQGSAMQQPLAVAIISGLVVQLPLVLLVMPVLFHALSKKPKHAS